MDDATRRDLERLTRPYYSFSDADYLADVSRGTSRRWLVGYRYRSLDGEHVIRPPVTPRSDGTVAESVSWVDLVEIVAIGKLKQVGFSLRAIRGIVARCQELLQVEYPLATLAFKTNGREIFVDRGEILLDVSHGRRKGLMAWDEVLGPYLERLDYQHEIAQRWWPLGRALPIVIDPEYGFGHPVVSETGVRTEDIAERFRVGERTAEIALDFNITPEQVEDALRFEFQRRVAA